MPLNEVNIALVSMIQWTFTISMWFFYSTLKRPLTDCLWGPCVECIFFSLKCQQCFHDDVIKWKHFSCYWRFVRGIHRWPVNIPHRSQWSGALMLSLICTQTNDWVNDWDAGDLRCHRAHYDVTVMFFFFFLLLLVLLSCTHSFTMWSWTKLSV